MTSKTATYRLAACLLALTLSVYAPVLAAPAGPTAIPSNPERSGQELTQNEIALFFAGAPVQSNAVLKELQKSEDWKRYAAGMRQSKQTLEKNRLKIMRDWGSKELTPQIPTGVPLYYMFSGPDFVTVNTLFPKASMYILCGLEPVGSVRDAGSIKSESLGKSLSTLAVSLKSIVNLSFFRTIDMQDDLQKGEFAGVLPVLYIFLSWTGNTVLDAKNVFLSPEGKLSESPTDDNIAGVHIVFSHEGRAAPQDLFYFKADLSDRGIEKKDGLLTFMEGTPRGVSYLKAASYLMHKPYFSKIRSFLLGHSKAILEDDSGIPLRFFNEDQWKITYYGSYIGVITLFKEHYQPLLRKMYETKDIRLLPFTTGYTYLRRANMLLAVEKLKETKLEREVMQIAAR